MIGIKEGQDAYFAQFAKLTKETLDEAQWLRTLREAAMDEFAELGFPTTQDEDWKYTNVEPIVEGSFQPAENTIGDLTRDRVAREQLTKLQCSTRLVFVNGFFSKALSSTGTLPGRVKITNLASHLKSEGKTLENHLGHYARPEGHGFVALNTALFRDGALIEVQKNCILEEPILLVFIGMPEGKPVVSHPRNLYLLGANSRATIIESYLTIGDDVHFTNAVSEMVLAEGAALEHYKLQQENERAFHIATLQTVQERSSRLLSHNICFGGAITRNHIDVALNAEGAECILGGLFVATGEQHIDNHTTLDHAKPNCNSAELYKGILADKGVGVFNGKILVRQDAQKTNAFQSNPNLLLSEDATIYSKPQLEIYADDVRCKHGATVGQLHEDALFYMRSRGIEKEAARDLLTYAFAGEVFDSMTWITVRTRLEALLFQKLSKTRQDTQA